MICSQPPRTASSASRADAVDRVAQRAGAGLASKVQSIVVAAVAEMLLQRQQLGVQQQRALELQDRVWLGSSSKMLPRLPKRVLRLITRHSRKRIDRRVGDLAELLAEEVVQAAIARRQHGERRVVAHRAHRLLGVLHHRRQDQLEILDREAVEDLPAAQLAALELGRLERAPLRPGRRDG